MGVLVVRGRYWLDKRPLGFSRLNVVDNYWYVKTILLNKVFPRLSLVIRYNRNALISHRMSMLSKQKAVHWNQRE
jgi:hypothetical protein